MPAKSKLKGQYQRLLKTGFAAILSRAAQRHGLEPAFVYAIASRETNCVNELGDFREGQYHGVGILQVDIQHPIARQARDNGTWKTRPDTLMGYGVAMLAANLAKAQVEFPSDDAKQHLRIAAAGYNCGIGTAILEARRGDCDRATTGHNYGADVIARMQVFAELVKVEPPGEELAL